MPAQTIQGVTLMEATTGRTSQEVFQHHAEVLIGGDVEGIVSDYADDAVFITPAGVRRGKDGVREGFVKHTLLHK
jgi:ketosteroid isomerase-like protein